MCCDTDLDEGDSPRDAELARLDLSNAAHFGDLPALFDALQRLPPMSRRASMSEALEASIDAGTLECARALVEAGADPNRGNPSPLTEALTLEDRDWLELFLEFGGLLDSEQVHSLLRMGDEPKVLERAIDIGFDVNYESRCLGQRALHVAAMYGYRDTVAVLLRSGAIDAVDSNGNTAARLAAVNQNHWLAEQIRLAKVSG